MAAVFGCQPASVLHQAAAYPDGFISGWAGPDGYSAPSRAAGARHSRRRMGGTEWTGQAGAESAGQVLMGAVSEMNRSPGERQG